MFGINFLRNLFTSHTKKKSEATMNSFGVFIRSAQSDVAIIDKCTELLRSFQSDSKILHVTRDQVHNGIKVFFNSGSGVQELLKKKFLSEGDASSTIHSLTTALSIHEAFPNDEEEFKKAIQDQIGNSISAQVLDIKKIPISSKYPEIGTGKWIIVLDIPEIGELVEFKTMGLPNNMVLKFPTNEDDLRVEFYCRLCRKDGHVQSRCSDSDAPHSSSAIHSRLNDPMPNEIIHECKPTGLFPKKEIHLPETSNSSTSSAGPPKNMVSLHPRPHSKLASGFRIRDRTEEMAERIPKPIGSIVKEFATELGREEVRRSLSLHDGIKEEVVEQISSPPNRPNVGNVSYSGDNQSSSATASSTTMDKDSLEIIFESSPKHRPECIQSPPDNSPVVTTTNQPPFKRELPTTDDEDSNSTTPTKRPKKTMQLLPVVIPDRIRDIISGMPRGALDVRQLEAFFNHVKKKSRPSDFAAMYTSDVEGLHSQLVAISRLYYMTPNAGSKADIQFMKMLGNVLKRFYNSPAQRRAARH